MYMYIVVYGIRLAAMISTDSHWHSPSDRPPEVRSHLFKKRETDLDSYGILMG